ncbi:DUF3772 domain-containing protein [Sphingomonas sp.]|uniref:DUF3772 domain-containing protein n=1 Tax=Sphingomonas sp. TaxID=28214 RepID=UPI003B3B558D
MKALAQCLMLLLLAAMAPPVRAQLGSPDPSIAAGQTLDEGRKTLTAVDKSLDSRLSRSERDDARDRANTVASQANTAAATLQTQMDLIDARIAQLGPVPTGIVEAPDIRAQRRLLAQQRATLDSQIKRAKLLAIDAQQLSDDIAASQAEQFNQRMSAHTASPLSPAFWSPVARNFPRDMRRTIAFMRHGADTFLAGLLSSRSWIALLGALIAVALLVPVRMWLRRAGRRYLVERAPTSRVRRSSYAVWLVLVGTLAPGFAALCLVQGLRWASMLSPGWDTIATSLIHISFVGAAIWALGGALLQRREPGWRPLPVSDQAVAPIRIWTWFAAGLTVISLLFMRTNDAIGISGPAAAAADVIVALVYLLLIIGLLFTIGRLQAEALRGLEDTSAPVQRTSLTLATIVGWAACIAAMIALLFGYISLARFVAFTIVWLAIVGSALYLLLNAVDDLSTTLFSSKSRLGRSAHYGLGVRQSTVEQVGVLTSAALRVILFALALGIVLMPFGTDVGSLFGTILSAAQGITIGALTISPGAIVRAIVVFVLALFLVGVVQNWLNARYLPATRLDASARNSIMMVTRYTGIVLAGLWALASLGLGMERIALLVSALSVGIGFGLQAITQNFVSGLILLAERPVKIGDWVKIADQEGDVKRIRVRATEIKVADGSTLIVPNSELITKTIQNMTLADPLGRIQLQFSVRLGTNAGQVRDIVTSILEDNPRVLTDPAPSVYIDQLADNRIFFNCFAYAASPRATYGIRSEILFALLERCAEAGIEIGTKQQIELIAAPGLDPRDTGEADA